MSIGVDLCIVVPIFNEEKILWDMAEQLAFHLDDIIGKDKWQYVLVDNGSIDSTPQIIERIKEKWPKSIPVRLGRPNIGEAFSAGLERAESEYAYIINADWWDPVFLQWSWSHRERYDLIVGSGRADYTLYKRSQYRKLLSWGLNSLLWLLFGFVGTDTHGQKLLRMSAMRPILKECVMRRGQFDTEFTIRAMRKGLWIAEVPVPHVEIRKPRNLMLKKIVQNVWDLWRLKRAIRISPATNKIRFHRYAREDME